MANYTAIADAGASIIEVLRDSLCPEPIISPDMIGLCSPAETGDLKLGLYLYSIRQNREYLRDERESLLVFTLYYLLTAYSDAGIKQRAYDESYILGAAMRTLYENSRLGDAYLQGSLGNHGEYISIDQLYLTPDEMQKIWIFPNVPYHTSVGYMVYPVVIDDGGSLAGPRVR